MIISLNGSLVWKNLPSAIFPKWNSLHCGQESGGITYSLLWYVNVISMVRGYFKHITGEGGRKSGMAKRYCRVSGVLCQTACWERRGGSIHHMLHSSSVLELSEGITLNSYITCSNKALLLRIIPFYSDSTSFPTSVHSTFWLSLQLSLSNVVQLTLRSTIRKTDHTAKRQKNVKYKHKYITCIHIEQMKQMDWIAGIYCLPASEEVLY